MFEFIRIDKKNQYNPLLLSRSAPFTQGWLYGDWQEAMGRKVKRFEIISARGGSASGGKNSETIGFFQTIKYPLPFGQSFLYIPHGPVIRDTNNIEEAFWKAFKKNISEIAEKDDVSFVRFDPFSAASGPEKYFSAKGGSLPDGRAGASGGKKTPSYAYSSSYFQPKYEWILNVDPVRDVISNGVEKSEEELLKNMYPKTRYSIRLAENKGVTVKIVENNLEKYFETFYNLMQKTAKRNKFGLHPKIYYQNIFNSCEKNKNALLTIAKFNDTILAINLILLYGEIAYFVFGASGDDFKNLMAPHLLHWKTIIEVKNMGYKIYNFGAVDGKKFSARGGPASGWEGISRFKKRFGGQILEYSDSYDLVSKPFWYYLYNLRKILKSK